MSFNSKTINFKAGLDTSQIATGVQKIQGHFSRLEKSTQKLSSVMGKVFAAGAISGALIGAVNFAKLGGEIEGVENAFRKMAQAGDLEKLREATRGMVSDLELMRQANFARSVGIDMQQLAQAMAYAQRYASATGKAMSEIMSDATMEMIRQTGLRLDNIGLSIEKVKERAKEIGFIPAMLEQMAENTKKFGSETLTTAERIQQMQTKVENVKNFLAGAFSKSLVTVGVVIETLIERFGLAFDILRIGFVNSIGSIFQRLFEAGVTLSTMFGPAGALGRGLISTFAGFADFQKEIIGDTSKVKTWADTWKDVAAIWSGKGANGMAGMGSAGAGGDPVAGVIRQRAESIKMAAKSLQGISVEMTELPQQLENVSADIQAPLGLIDEQFWSFITSLKSAIADFASAMITDFASAIGEALIMGGDTFKTFGQQALETMGRFFKQIGSMFVSYGIAAMEFTKTLLVPANAPALIAAGIALAAIGGAITAASKQMANTGQTSATSGVPSSSFNQGYNFESRLDGYDLVLVSSRNQRLMNRRG